VQVMARSPHRCSIKSLFFIILQRACPLVACEAATPIQGSGTFVDNGSTSQANPVDEDSSALSCSLVSSSTRGVWYLLQGDGRCYGASTEGSAFDTVLAVYESTSGCELLSCTTESAESDFGSIFWSTTYGLNYYIFVGGYFEETGQYTVAVTVSRGKPCFSFMFCASPLLPHLGRNLSSACSERQLQ